MFSASNLGSGGFGLLFLTFIAFVLVLCCLVLHSRHHLSVVYKSMTMIISGSNNRSRKLSSSSSKSHIDQQSCCISFRGDLEFYPLSTLCYFALVLAAICGMTLFHHQSFQTTIQIAEFCPIRQNILSFLEHPTQTTSIALINHNDFMPHWSYIVQLLSLVESLFNFYRYYDASYMVLHLRNATRHRIFALFSIYMICFSAIYLIQIHLYFALSPLIILVHLVFNFHCIVRFVLILRRQCQDLCNQGTAFCICTEN